MPIKTKRNALTSKLFLAKLASSGLTLDDARRLRIDALDDGGKILPAASGAPVMRLAYADLDGRPTGFYRLRLLADPPGFASALAKPSRYLQPPDTGVAAYLAPGIDWRALSKDTTAPLYITEGELKAASACVRGLPTIGLGGVYSWRSAKSGVAFLPELEAIAWAGRHVFLVFDSDAQTNHQVMRALRHLCRELTDRGAQPYVAKLPPLSDDGKTGLDDLLVAGGTDALSSVLEAAEPFGPAEELWRLNDQVCFVRDPGFVVELATGMRMSVVSFSKEVYANLFYHEREETKAGFRLVKRATAAEWIKWAHRLEAARLTYAPGHPPLTDAGELNTWRGPGIVPRAGDVTPWTRLLDHLFDDERAGRTWFERWCAYPLRHPGTKLLTAAVLWGVHQGTGKSLLGYSLAQLYGERNVSEINQEHLRAPYNDWLVDKQLVLGEEITGSDRRADAQRGDSGGISCIARSSIGPTSATACMSPMVDAASWYCVSSRTRVSGSTAAPAFRRSYRARSWAAPRWRSTTWNTPFASTLETPMSRFGSSPRSRSARAWAIASRVSTLSSARSWRIRSASWNIPVSTRCSDCAACADRSACSVRSWFWRARYPVTPAAANAVSVNTSSEAASARLRRIHLPMR